MSNIIYPNEKELEDLIENNELVLIDFYSPWCPPCKMLSLSINKLANNYQDKIVIAKINIHKEPGLTTKYNVTSIPHLFLSRDSKIVKNALGFQPYAKLVEFVEN